ncbi:MAG: hypothetical protein AB1567_07720 [bacterium]
MAVASDEIIKTVENFLKMVKEANITINKAFIVWFLYQRECLEME